MDANTQNEVKKQIIEVKPKISGFLWAYIILSIPSFIGGFVSLIVTIIIFISIFSGINSLSSTDTSKLKLNYIKTSNKSQSGILIYDLKGPIDTGDDSLSSISRNTGIYTNLVAKDFTEIKNNRDIKNVVFRLNTPGGTIFASEVLGDLIADLMKNKNQDQPIFYFDQLVASGGLLATYKNQNSYVIGSDYGETGSIGVILTLPNFKSLADKVGYSETVIKSSPSKDIGSPLRDITPQEKAHFQEQVDTSYDKFITTVANARKQPKDAIKAIANGFTYDNTRAKDIGLINEIGDINVAIAKAKANANLGDDYNIWEINTDSRFLGGLIANSSIQNIFGISTGATKVIDRATFFKSGRVYAIDENKI